jgi:hypothetical protein
VNVAENRRFLWSHGIRRGHHRFRREHLTPRWSLDASHDHDASPAYVQDRPMRLPALLVLVALPLAGAAQPVPPHLLGAHSVGQAASHLSRAQPCFPRDPRAEAALARMLAEATARIHSDPERRAVFERARMLADTQQRYIAPSDPVACREVVTALQFFLAQ